MSSTLGAQQIIYGWIERGMKKGHQLVTKSQGISQEDLEYIDSHSTVTPVSISSFRECNRFFQLPSGRLAFNYVKNIGKDAYGRDGALYSHFLLLSPPDFVKMDSDFTHVDGMHLRGISTIHDLQRFNTGGGFIPLPEALVEDDHSSEKVESTLVPRNIIHELLKVIGKGKKITLKGKSIENRLQILWNMENLFPDGIWFSYSTCNEWKDGEKFISINFPEEVNGSQDGSFIVDLDIAADNPSRPLSDTNDRFMWAMAGAIEATGKLINDSLKSMKFQEKPLNERVKLYFKALAETYLDLAISGDLDQNEAMEVIIEYMDSNHILDTEYYMDALSQIVLGNSEHLRYYIKKRMETIASVEDPELSVSRFINLLDFALKNSRESHTMELLYNLYRDSPLSLSKFCFQEIVNHLLEITDYPDSMLQFLDVADPIFAEWFRNVMKDKEQSSDSIITVIDTLCRMKNRSTEIALLIQKIFNDTIKKKDTSIDPAIQCFIGYSNRIESSSRKEMAKHILDLIEKEKIDPQYDYEKILLELSERKSDDDEDEESSRRGLFRRK